MRNPLQEQLLKAGLVKKAQLAQVAREQEKQRHGKKAPPPNAQQIDAEQARAARVERDRALAAERNAQARAQELRAQVRHIVETSQVPARGELDYRFVDGDAIRSLQVDNALRSQLSVGALVIVRHGNGYALLPRAAAGKVRERDGSMIVVDHAHGARAAPTEVDEYYAKFQVPDDLIW